MVSRQLCAGTLICARIEVNNRWSSSESLGSNKRAQTSSESSPFCGSETRPAPFGRFPGGFTPPNSVAVFSFHFQIIPKEHGLSPIALTRKKGRMQLPRQLIREHSLKKKTTGKCFRKSSFELRKKYVRILINYNLRIQQVENAYFILLTSLICTSWLGITMRV